MTGRSAVGGLRKALAGAVAAGLAVGVAPTWSQDAPWVLVNNDKACGASRGAVMIGSPDGVRYGLFVSDVSVGGQALRTVLVDGKPFLLRFGQNGTGAFADLDSGALGAMSAGARLTIDWGDRHIETVTSDLLPALNKVQACGAGLQARRVAEAQSRERQARRRSALRSFMDSVGGDSGSDPGDIGVPGPPPIPGVPRMGTVPGHMGGAGVVCRNTGERVSGMNKNCVYDCLGSQAVQTIGVAELCPMTMQR